MHIFTAHQGQCLRKNSVKSKNKFWFILGYQITLENKVADHYQIYCWVLTGRAKGISSIVHSAFQITTPNMQECLGRQWQWAEFMHWDSRDIGTQWEQMLCVMKDHWIERCCFQPKAAILKVDCIWRNMFELNSC